MVNAKQAALASLYFKYRDEEEIVEMLEEEGLNIWALDFENLVKTGHLVPYIITKSGKEGLAAASPLARRIEQKLEKELWDEYWGR